MEEYSLCINLIPSPVDSHVDVGPLDVPRLDQPLDGLVQVLSVGEGAGLVAVGPIILLPDLLNYDFAELHYALFSKCRYAMSRCPMSPQR